MSGAMMQACMCPSYVQWLNFCLHSNVVHVPAIKALLKLCLHSNVVHVPAIKALLNLCLQCMWLPHAQAQNVRIQGRNAVAVPLRTKLGSARACTLHILKRFEFDPALLR